MSTLKQWLDTGIIHQVSHPEETDLDNKQFTFYAGFDPTADSLHLGHLFVLITMSKLQKLGHKPIAVIGGATGMIGDPSGKSKERVLLSEADILKNCVGITAQIEKFIRTEDGGIVVNNLDWFKNFSFITFLRDVGKMFRLGEMIAKDSVQKRLHSDEGISFTEFSYQILQSYDFCHLCETYGCNLQIGGSDQWGNITAGIDLTRKKTGKQVVAFTLPLITSSSGEKFGKTAGGENLWLDLHKTSPYNFYQFWIQTGDDLVIQYLRFFTYLREEDIQILARSLSENPEKREAQKMLAFEVTSIVHGREEAAKVLKASRVLFGEAIEGLNDQDLQGIFCDVPSVTFKRSELEDGSLLLVDVLVSCGLCQSKREARNLIQQGGGYINNNRIDDDKLVLGRPHLASETTLVLRSGKKKYTLIRFE